MSSPLLLLSSLARSLLVRLLLGRLLEERLQCRILYRAPLASLPVSDTGRQPRPLLHIIAVLRAASNPGATAMWTSCCCALSSATGQSPPRRPGWRESLRGMAMFPCQAPTSPVRSFQRLAWHGCCTVARDRPWVAPEPLLLPGRRAVQ